MVHAAHPGLPSPPLSPGASLSGRDLCCPGGHGAEGRQCTPSSQSFHTGLWSGVGCGPERPVKPARA